MEDALGSPLASRGLRALILSEDFIIVATSSFYPSSGIPSSRPPVRSSGATRANRRPRQDFHLHPANWSLNYHLQGRAKGDSGRMDYGIAGPRERGGVNLTGFWRLYEIHRLIAQGTYPTCPSLAARLEVTPRTVERDIGRLRDLFGAPIEYDRARRGYHYSGRFEMPPVRLTEGEALTVFLGQRLLSQCKGTPFEDAVRRALAKIKMMLPQQAEVGLDQALGMVSFHSEPLRGQELLIAKHYELLAKAIGDRRTVTAGYYTASRRSLGQRRINPYHLRFYDGAWYCIGFCRDRREVRTFALDRMSEVEVTGETFPAPAGFSIAEYLGGSLAIERGDLRRVVIEFDPAAAPYITDRQWHHSQVLETRPDGGLRMTLRVGGLGEVMRWVMSLGSQAWVIEPAELRSQIAAALEAARSRY